MEPLNFAVGLWPIGAGFLGLDVQFPAGIPPEVGFVGGSVVGEDPFNGDSEDGEPGHGPFQDGYCGGRGFVAVDLGVGDPGMVVNDRVHVGRADDRMAAAAGSGWCRCTVPVASCLPT